MTAALVVSTSMVVSARPLYLPDQSVMSYYWRSSLVRERIDQLALDGLLCSSVVTMDEARYSARSKRDLRFITETYEKSFTWLPTLDDLDERVCDLRTSLWEIGAGRGAQVTDTIIAVVAMQHGAVVVHNDTDFATIARAVPEFKQLRIVP